MLQQAGNTWNLFVWFNPPKEGLFQSNRGLLASMYIYQCLMLDKPMISESFKVLETGPGLERRKKTTR